MELGETVCRPARPDCPACPVAFACRAYRELPDPAVLPTRASSRSRPHFRGAVVVLVDRGRWLVQRRPETGLLPGLWEFPGGKIEPGERADAAARRELREETGFGVRHLVRLGTVRHAYSHFTVELHAFAGRPSGSARASGAERPRWVTRSEFARLAVPKATQKVAAFLARPQRSEAPIPGRPRLKAGGSRPSRRLRQTRGSRTGGRARRARPQRGPGPRAPGRTREG